MSQTLVAIATKTDIEIATYENKGVVRFQRRDRGWWVCLSDMVAMYPTTDGQPFNLEKWLNLNPQTMAALDLFLERKGEEVWGAYAIAIELARVPQADEFRDFPLWVATRGRRPIE